MINWLNSPFGVAIIGALAVIFAALIGLGNPLTQQFLSDRAERRRQKEAQKKTRTEEEARRQFIERCLQGYRARLSADQTITRIKIPYMTAPVELTSVYIAQRLQPAVSPGPSVTFARGHDPNVLLQVGLKRIEESYAAQGTDPLQALHDKKQCVILGDPGSGKTTLLKYLTIQALAGQLQGMSGLLPIYIELSKFAESQKENLLDFIAEDWDRTYGFDGHARAHLEPCLRDGKILLLLDALDEAALGASQEERRASSRRVFTAIEQLIRGYSPYLMVTARSAGYRLADGSLPFAEFEVSAFRPQDISVFVTQWFNLPGPGGAPDAAQVARGSTLNARLRGNIRLQTLAANPLLLTLMTLLYERDEDLPERRADLYRRAVTLLLSEWDRARSLDRYPRPALDIEQKKTLLSDIAWHFHKRHMRYFAAAELHTLIADFLASAGLPTDQSRHVLDEISAGSGLLKAQADEWYGFLHLTFQEYFAARYAVHERRLNELVEHRGEPWWEEVILLYAGSVPDITPLLEKLLGRDSTQPLPDDIFSTNLMLAARCLAAHYQPGEEPPALQQAVTDQLFALLLHSSSAFVRERAAETLAELGNSDDGVNARLLQLLGDGHTGKALVQSIAGALRTYGARRLAPRLFALLSDPALTDESKEAIASVVAEIGDVSMIAPSLPRLTDRQASPHIRTTLIDILGNAQDRSHASELLSILLDNQDMLGIRLSAAVAWPNAGDPAATQQLIAKITDAHTDENSRSIILLALSKQPDLLTAVPAFLRLVSSKQSSLARIAVNIATNYILFQNNPAFMTEFLKLMADSQLPLSLRLSLVESLVDYISTGSSDYSTVRPDLRSLYDDPATEQALKPGLALALYLLGDDTAGLDVRTMLAGAKTYGLVEQRLAERLDTATLLPMLSDASIATPVRVGIAGQLAGIKDAEAIVPDLRALAGNRKLLLDVRQETISTLGKIAGDQASAETLAELLNRDQQVREAAERALWLVCRRAGLRAIEDPLTRRVMLEAGRDNGM